MVARTLDADERVQLQVLKAATEASAPVYAAILGVLAAAKDRYQIQVRTEEIERELTAHAVGVGTLSSSLEQLKDWGAITWTQDTSRVARLEDFNRRRELWQLTAAGHAAHDAVLAVLGAAEQAGSLQRALFRDIRESLDAVAAAVDASGPRRARRCSLPVSPATHMGSTVDSRLARWLSTPWHGWPVTRSPMTPPTGVAPGPTRAWPATTSPVMSLCSTCPAGWPNLCG